MIYWSLTCAVMFDEVADFSEICAVSVMWFNVNFKSVPDLLSDLWVLQHYSSDALNHAILMYMKCECTSSNSIWTLPEKKRVISLIQQKLVRGFLEVYEGTFVCVNDDRKWDWKVRERRMKFAPALVSVLYNWESHSTQSQSVLPFENLRNIRLDHPFPPRDPYPTYRV